jgi:hypothetical protein
VIPKTTTNRPATPARLHRRPSLPFGRAPTWPCPSRMQPRAGHPPGLPNGTQRAVKSCDCRRRVIPDAGRFHRECRSLALRVRMGRSLGQYPNPKHERGVLARSDGTIAGPISELQARARGLGPVGWDDRWANVRTPSASAWSWPVARAPGSDYAARRRAITPHSHRVRTHPPSTISDSATGSFSR